MFLTDFHLHSTFSDGKLSIPQLVDLYGSRGFGAIAITDQICSRLLGRTLTRAIFPLYLEILHSEARRARREYGMLLIPGFKLARHVIGLGVTEWIDANEEIPELAIEVRAQSALAVAARPLTSRLWHHRDELSSAFDAWECTDGNELFHEVMETSLPKLASSGLRRPEQLTGWKTLLDCERTQASVLAAVREQRVSFVFYDDEVKEYDTVGRNGFVSLGLRYRARARGKLAGTKAF